MWKTILIATCVLWGVMETNATPKNMEKRSSGAYSGSYSGSSGGNSGNYNDYDDYGYAPDFGFGFNFIDPYAFHQQLTSQILAQNAAHQNAIASTFTMGDATVTAGASNLPYDFQDYNDLLQRQHAVLFDNIQKQNKNSYGSSNGNGYGSSYGNGYGSGHGSSYSGSYGSNKNSKDNRYAPSYSAAAASIGTQGGHQTAYISPENPDVPNISTRFGSSSPDGFKGVSVSSYSSSSDINGKKSSHRGAQTTVNDNGRITTYKVES